MSELARRIAMFINGLDAGLAVTRGETVDNERVAREHDVRRHIEIMVLGLLTAARRPLHRRRERQRQQRREHRVVIGAGTVVCAHAVGSLSERTPSRGSS